jgi:SAM-dependent methyltransferase
MVVGIPAEDGTVDYLLIGTWAGANEQALWRWKEATPELHDFMPDYHRLQLEYWIWKHWKAGNLAGQIIDIGVQERREYLGDGYVTVGERDCDITADLTLLYPSDLGGEVDAIICTEVLEHCADPFQAVRRMHECLKPGGLLLVTSPFLWPDHGIEGEYGDYWRFTAGGWRLLLSAFSEVKLTECAWTSEGAAAYDLLRRWEGFGFTHLVRGATGYLVEARKGL